MSTTRWQNLEFGSRFLEEILEWISDNLEPNDVFTKEELAAWAAETGDWETSSDYEALEGERDTLEEEIREEKERVGLLEADLEEAHGQIIELRRELEERAQEVQL